MILFLIPQDKAQMYMKYLVDSLPTVDNMYKVGILYNMRTIGTKWLAVLTEHKALFEELKDIPQLHDSCQYCLDLIEGRT